MIATETKYKLINGWTKDRVIEQIEQKNGFKQCVGHRGDCKYRGQNGSACFVGAFIPDSEYCTSFDVGIDAFRLLMVASPDLQRHMPLEPMGMNMIQTIHDRLYTCKDTLIEWLNDNVLD